mmetsp:Transcript_19782/g.46814  ORF Transcript_19782/g.46814 Transcript_19782/m.46814 type:complete len:205 (+) Transcript_19782:254-868(+)
MSAKSDLNSDIRSSGAYNRGNTRSPLRSPASTARRSTSKELVRIPACFFPVAINWAPVSVAMSITQSKFSMCFVAWFTPSASTRRPSASQLFTSTVFPESIVKMSSLRNADGPMAFSQRQSNNVSLWGTLRLTAAEKAPSRPAAPPISPFIPHMPVLDLRLRPPVSYIIPFPTSAIVCVSSVCVLGSYLSITRRGGSTAQRPTA